VFILGYIIGVNFSKLFWGRNLLSSSLGAFERLRRSRDWVLRCAGISVKLWLAGDFISANGNKDYKEL
jgi:hypothetical protein